MPAPAPAPTGEPAAPAKPALTPAEAELETYVRPSPAKSKKPSFAMASAVPEPSTLGTPDDEPQGDTGDPTEADNASLPWSPPQAKRGPKPKVTGAFHVQVGAYTSESEAENRLGVVQSRAAELLDGHLPFTTSFTKDNSEWYRARFAGFSKGAAQSACESLKKMSVDCVVMRAE